jgi:uncharacterized protein (TIGR02246 family)
MTTTKTDEAWRATLEIQELISRYNHAADAGDGEALAATFTEDGVLEFLGRRVAGRKELIALGSILPARERGGRHLTTNTVVTVESDNATARSVFVKVIAGAPAAFGGSATFCDELRRTPDGWRFSRRRATADV